jgi:hypothetical protein
MTKVKKKARLPTGFMMTSYEIGPEKYQAFLGRFRGLPVKPFKNLTFVGIILPFKNLTLLAALGGRFFRA